ncbi:hypothetical protein Q7P37_002746 [Cladosporium fusiforme]
MAIVRYHIRDFTHTDLKNHRAVQRDIVMGIGPEGYADIDDVSLDNEKLGNRKRIKLECTAIQARKKSTEDQSSSQALDVTPKPSASSPPLAQREPKNSKQSAEIDGDDNSEAASETTSKSAPKGLRASTTPLAESGSKSAPAEADADDSDDLILVDVKELPPTSKRKTSVSSRGDSAKRRRKQTEDSDDDSEADAASAKRGVIVPASSWGKVSGSSGKKGKKAENVEGDSEPETPSAKRGVTGAVSSRDKSSVPSGKKRNQTEDADSESEPETPSIRRPKAVPTSGRGRAIKPFQKRPEQAEESQAEDEEPDESASQVESDHDDEEDEDPRETQREIFKYTQEFNKSCRSCKTNANKLLKTKYETELRQVKNKSKKELSDAKATARKELKAAKDKADEDKENQRERFEDKIDDLKASRSEKIKVLNSKHDNLQGKFNDMKAKLEEKNKKLTKERDEAEAKRKEIEKSTNEELRDMKADMKADQLRLNEQRKQMNREKNDELNDLRPAHSNLLKAKERDIKNLAEKALSLERELKETEDELRRVRTEDAANKQRYSLGRQEVTRAFNQVRVVEENLREFDEYSRKLEQRAQLKQAGFEEKLEAERANLQQQTNRLVEQQRQNLHLKETLQRVARHSGQKDKRISELEADLKATKADVRLAKETDAMVDS